VLKGADRSRCASWRPRSRGLGGGAGEAPQARELSGGTFTVTSLGSTAADGHPDLNHPEVAILGVQKLRKRRWCGERRGDQIVIRPEDDLSLSSITG